MLRDGADCIFNSGGVTNHYTANASVIYSNPPQMMNHEDARDMLLHLMEK